MTTYELIHRRAIMQGPITTNEVRAITIGKKRLMNGGKINLTEEEIKEHAKAIELILSKGIALLKKKEAGKPEEWVTLSEVSKIGQSSVSEKEGLPKKPTVEVSKSKTSVIPEKPIEKPEQPKQIEEPSEEVEQPKQSEEKSEEPVEEVEQSEQVEEALEETDEPEVPEVPEEPVEQSEEPKIQYSEEELSKLSKAKLLELVQELGLEIDESLTKKAIIKTILEIS